MSALNTKAFGFDQIVDLNSDTIKFGGVTRNLDNFDGQTFDREFLDNNEGKMIDLLNGFYFDFDLGYENLYSITIQDTGPNKSRLIFDYRTSVALLPNETLIIDPTFGNISATVYRSLTTNSADANCNSGSTIDSTSTLYKGASTGSDNCRVFALSFDVSNFPSTAIVTDTVWGYTAGAPTNAINCDIKPMASDPSGLSAAVLYTDITDGTAYVSNDATCTTAGAKTEDLGATADADLQTAITGDGVFAFGVSFNSMTRDASAHTIPITVPVLLVTFNMPPDPPKLTNGTVTTTTGVNLFWSIPAQNGGSGTVTYDIQDSEDGSTFSSLETQSSTSYTDVFPYDQDYGYYRVYSNDTLGYSPGYSFPLNQTISDDVLSHLPYDYVLTDQGIEGNTPTATGNTLYVDGHNGGASYFDGSSYDVMPNESDYDFQITNPFSIALWADTTGTTQAMVTKSDGASNGWFLWKTGAGKAEFRIRANAISYPVISTTSINSGDPVFIVATYSGNSNGDGMKIYINGALETTGASSAMSVTMLNNEAVTIGAFTTFGSKFIGSLDEVRIFDSELDANTVSQLYNERLYTGDLAIPPNAVDDLTGTTTSFTTVLLSWTAPDVFGTILGYMINFTTPFGDPTVIYVNDTATTATTATIDSLVVNANYSFRVSPVTLYGTNGSGNIWNGTTSTNFDLGALTDLDRTNTDDFKIFFERDDINSTAMYLNVTYPNSYDLSCDFSYQLARVNQTYNNLTSKVIDVDDVESSFLILNQTNDVIHVECWDNNSDDEAFYVITIADFPLKEQIENLRNGTYGTYFKIGLIDGVTLLIVILSMIGFNRTNPVLGIIFLVVTIGTLSFFEIITYPIIMYPALALLVVWGFISTRKDD